MSLNRSAAVTSGSRLYRQVATALPLLRQRLTIRSAFCSLRREVIGAKSVYRSFADVANAGAAVQQALLKQASQVSSYHLLPILAAATTSAYYDPAFSNDEWRQAYKTAMCALVARSNSGTGASVAGFVRTVQLAAILNELIAVLHVFTATDDGFVEQTDEGLRLGGACVEAKDDLDASMAPASKLLRFPQLAFDTVLGGLDRSLDEIHQLIEEPEILASLPLISKTALANLKEPLPAAFWAGLAARAHMFYFARSVAGRVTDDDRSIAIMPPAMPVPARLARALAEQTHPLFATPNAAAATPLELWPNFVVNHPVLPLTAGLVVTSPPMIADSITWFAESSVMEYPSSVSVRLRPTAFRTLVSQPLEDAVVATMLRLRYQAGPVSDRGEWRLSDGVRQMPVPPGEIDCLAADPSFRHYVVIECKAMGLPLVSSRLRNLLKAIGPEDDQSFHVKLRRKCNYVKNMIAGEGSDVRGVVTLDRRFPGMNRGQEYPVISLESLPDFVEWSAGYSP